MRPLALALFGWVVASTSVYAEPCTRDSFEAVVDEASSTLVSLTQKNTPAFQSKLRALKDKRGWSQDQFLREGATFVQDPTITGFDETSQRLLVKINSQDTGTADCRLLEALKATMAELVATQNAKWAYMFAKVEQALAQ